MSDLILWPNWPLILVLGYPAFTIAILEFSRHLDARAPSASSILRHVAYVLLPTGALWLILRLLARLPTRSKRERPVSANAVSASRTALSGVGSLASRPRISQRAPVGNSTRDT